MRTGYSLRSRISHTAKSPRWRPPLAKRWPKCVRPSLDIAPRAFAAEILQGRRALASAGVQLTTDIEYFFLSSAHTNMLCLILREAVTNVIRHAGATICHLQLHRNGDLLTMSIEDNGSGKLGSEGNGLRGMRERLASAGGTLQRECSPQGGTRLTVEFPTSGGRQAVRPSDWETSNAVFDVANSGTVQA